MKKDYYEILEISKNASDEVVEKAYKALVKKYHPDLKEGEEKKQAEDIIKEINEAYEVISNPDKRKEYDGKYTILQTNSNIAKIHTKTTIMKQISKIIRIQKTGKMEE